MALRRTATLFKRFMPSPEAPTQVILRELVKEQPLTTEQVGMSFWIVCALEMPFFLDTDVVHTILIFKGLLKGIPCPVSMRDRCFCEPSPRISRWSRHTQQKSVACCLLPFVLPLMVCICWQIWTKIYGNAELFPNKLSMKRCLKFLKTSERIVAKPLDPRNPVGKFGYLLGKKPNIVNSEGTAYLNAPGTDQEAAAKLGETAGKAQ